MPTGTVTRFSFVMMSLIGRSGRFSNRRSRLVRMPTSVPSLLPSSVIGTPLIRNCFISSSASEMWWRGDSVIGLTIMPLSDRFTRSISPAWSSMLRFLWTTPMPPCWAIAMAKPLSVTVSIAAERIGTFRRMLRVSRELKSTWLGSTCECCGTSRTSSNVSTSGRPAETCCAALSRVVIYAP